MRQISLITRLTVVTVAIGLLLAPLPASAAPNRVAWPGAGVYGECTGDQWVVYADLTESQSITSNVFATGDYVAGQGWNLESGLAYLFVDTLTYGVGTLSLTSQSWLFAPSGAGDHRYVHLSNEAWVPVHYNQPKSSWAPMSAGWVDVSPAVPMTWFYNQNFFAYSTVAGRVTALRSEGTFVGTCPLLDWPNVPAGASDHVRPLRDDVLYEVNHISGSGPIVDDVHTELRANVYNSQAGQVAAIETSGSGYLVKVVSADDSYTLYSNLTSVYPALNDTITAGCVLGQAGESFKQPNNGPYTQDPGLLWFFAGTDFYEAASNVYIDWQTEWSQPPLAAVPCGNELRTDNCLNYNPRLDDNARGWSTYNIDEIDIGLDKVKLTETGAYIYQTTVLDHSLDYYVTLKLASYHDYDMITVMVLSATTGDLVDQQILGLDLELEGVGYGEWLIKTIGPLDLTDYDVNDAYDIAIVEANPNPAQPANVWIDDVCINDGSVVVSVPHCYFPDYDLDDRTQWDYDAGADWDSTPANFGNGVVLGPGEWISGPVSLAPYEADDAEYKLRIGAKVTAVDLGDIGDLFGSGWIVTTSQEIVDGALVELDVGDLTINNVLINMSYDTRFTILDDTPIIGDLKISTDPLATKNLYINMICIEPVTGVWPGTEDPDIGGTEGACINCPMPTTVGLEALVAWVSWLWCNISSFFTCILAVYLDLFGEWLANISAQLGLFGRYLALLAAHLALWAIDLLTAFGQALIDGFIYALAWAWSAIVGTGLFELLYDILGLMLALISRLLGAGGNGLSFAVSWFQSLLYFGHLVSLFAASIISSLASEPIVSVLPSCTGELAGIADGYCFVVLMTNGIIDEFPALTTTWLLAGAVCALLTIMVSMDELGDVFGDI